MSKVEVESKVLEKQLDHLAMSINSIIFDQRKYLMGRILTIVEATASDPEQRKAIKNVVTDLFHEGSYWNEPRYMFQQFAEAYGIEGFLEPTTIGGLTEPAAPLNPFQNIAK